LRVLLVESSARTARALVEGLLVHHDVVGVCSRAGDAIERLTHLDDERCCLRRHPVDVIVIGDQLAGEVCGRRLLETVAQLWPRLWRIFLTSDDLRSVRDAHGIVRRPASPEDVLRAIERAVAAHDVAGPSNVERIG
jgi:hypothetical protein